MKTKRLFTTFVKEVGATTLPVFLLLGLALASCAPPGSDSGSQNNAPGSSAGQRVEIKASKYQFSPRELKIKASQPVTVALTSADGNHSFDVDALNIHTNEAGKGETVVAEFKVDQPGKYEFYCGHSGHKERGMTGTLEITP